jgi:predicted transcriptional regulator
MVAELAERGEPLAYTTVMTTLARLHDKGALLRRPAGRSYTYTPAADPDGLEAALTARQMTRLLGDGAQRAETLARFVADLRPEDERLLADILAAQHPEPEAPGPRSDPVGSDPVGSDPIGSDPVGSDPVGSDPVGSDPIGSDPIGSDPVGSDPVGSARTDPDQQDGAGADRAGGPRRR